MGCKGVDNDLGKWNRPWSVSLVFDWPKLRFAMGTALYELSVNENTSAEPVHAVVGDSQSLRDTQPRASSEDD